MELYLDDLQVGQRFGSGVYQMTEERIKAFAAEFDPQSFHLDEAVAEASIFKGLVASGWHTAAVAMRLMVTGGLILATGMIGLEGEIAWPRPTRPGDILRVESEIVEIRPSHSKPNQGNCLCAKRDVESARGGSAGLYREDPRIQTRVEPVPITCHEVRAELSQKGGAGGFVEASCDCRASIIEIWNTGSLVSQV